MLCRPGFELNLLTRLQFALALFALLPPWSPRNSPGGDSGPRQRGPLECRPRSLHSAWPEGHGAAEGGVRRVLGPLLGQMVGPESGRHLCRAKMAPTVGAKFFRPKCWSECGRVLRARCCPPAGGIRVRARGCCTLDCCPGCASVPGQSVKSGSGRPWISVLIRCGASSWLGPGYVVSDRACLGLAGSMQSCFTGLSPVPVQRPDLRLWSQLGCLASGLAHFEGMLTSIRVWRPAADPGLETLLAIPSPPAQCLAIAAHYVS